MSIVKNTYTSKDLQQMWSNKLARSFSLFSTSVAMRRVPVTIAIEPYPNVPAYSSSDNITLMHDANQNIGTGPSIRRLKGLTIHELAHVLYTPRERTDLGKWLKEHRQFFTSFNILEDSRIENLIIARMSGVQPWLINVITTEILSSASPMVNKERAYAEAYPLVYGRKYLNPKVVAGVEREFVKYWPELLSELHDVVDDYITISFHDKGDLLRAVNLIKRFYEVLHAMNGDNHHKQDPHGDTCSTPNSQGGEKPLGKRETDKDIAKVKDMADKQKQDVEQHLNDDSSDTSDNSTGNSGDSTDSDTPDVEQVLQTEQADSEYEVSKDVKNTLEQAKSIGGSPAGGDVGGNLRKMYDRITTKAVPSDIATKNMRVFAKHLADVKALADPYWENRTNNGRLNVRNFLLERNIDEAFDLWNDSMSEATDIEAVVLLDDSASMSSIRESAAETMWAIKRAFDTVEASTTVINYGSAAYDCVQVYGANERAGNTVKYENNNLGGTNPTFALSKAHEILRSSPRAIKIMLIITDGLWESEEEAERSIISMREEGVLTGLAFIYPENLGEYFKSLFPTDEDGSMAVDAHRCEVATDVTDPIKLVDFAKSLADLSRAKLYNK